MSIGSEALAAEYDEIIASHQHRTTEVHAAPIGVWWEETAEADFRAFEPKLAEYGSHDLLVIGKGLNPELCDQDAIEAGIAFYLLGKVARMTEAYRNGRLPSPDSWHDAAVYSMMGRRVRQHGALA